MKDLTELKIRLKGTLVTVQNEKQSDPENVAKGTDSGQAGRAEEGVTDELHTLSQYTEA